MTEIGQSFRTACTLRIQKHSLPLILAGTFNVDLPITFLPSSLRADTYIHHTSHSPPWICPALDLPPEISCPRVQPLVHSWPHRPRLPILLKPLCWSHGLYPSVSGPTFIPAMQLGLSKLASLHTFLQLSLLNRLLSSSELTSPWLLDPSSKTAVPGSTLPDTRLMPGRTRLTPWLAPGRPGH